MYLPARRSLSIVGIHRTEVAFLAAITSKGLTAHEIAGAWEAIYELDTVKVSLEIPKPVLENCGTGMDKIKTFNINTAAAIVAAAGGVYLARHGARAITSHYPFADVFRQYIEHSCISCEPCESVPWREGSLCKRDGCPCN